MGKVLNSWNSFLERDTRVIHKVLIGGKWRYSNRVGEFRSENPATIRKLPDSYPVSSWTDVSNALDAAQEASRELRHKSPEEIAAFLEKYADRIEGRTEDLVRTAHLETTYPEATRLQGIELPRTTGQIRQAAAAARDRSWTNPVISTATNIRSMYGAKPGSANIFGPNNFPYAFGSASGGDAAAALAAGMPIIAKANTSHPETTRIFAEEAYQAAMDTHMPPSIVQLIYRTEHSVGEQWVADARTGATAYTGSRAAGLELKLAADTAGRPFYAELSSVNPVVILPGALEEDGRLDVIAEEYVTSGLLGVGQFCTNPGITIVYEGDNSEALLQAVTTLYEEAPVGTLLSEGVERNLAASIKTLRDAGAELVTGDTQGSGTRYSRANTLLRVSGVKFLEDPKTFQTEAFGNAGMYVFVTGKDEAKAVIMSLEGSLTGTFYLAEDGRDDQLYAELEPELRSRVGRLLNNKMPTGVAVDPAMNHGGPHPAGNPNFTAVGIPASLLRFGMLQCYDNVGQDLLPGELQDVNSNRGVLWRNIDGAWTQGDVAPKK